VTVQLEDALHSGHELEQVRDQLMSKFGTQVVGAAVPPDGSAVDVIVTSDHLGLTRQIEQVGPSGTVKVREGTGGAT
jgi:hypothetical protein